MNPNTWMLFALAYLLATLTPGPNVLLVVKNGLQHGWRAALVSILGNLGCQAILIGLVAMGVGALLQTLPPLFVALKLAGVATWCIWATRRCARPIPVPKGSLPPPRGDAPEPPSPCCEKTF